MGSGCFSYEWRVQTGCSGGQAGKSGTRCHAKQTLPDLRGGEDVLWFYQWERMSRWEKKDKHLHFDSGTPWYLNTRSLLFVLALLLMSHMLCVRGSCKDCPLLKSCESSKDKNKYTIYPKIQRRNDAGKPGRIGHGAGEEVTAQPHVRMLQWELRIVTLSASMLTLLTYNQTAEKGFKKCILFSFVGKWATSPRGGGTVHCPGMLGPLQGMGWGGRKHRAMPWPTPGACPPRCCSGAPHIWWSLIWHYILGACLQLVWFKVLHGV